MVPKKEVVQEHSRKNKCNVLFSIVVNFAKSWVGVIPSQQYNNDFHYSLIVAVVY